VLSKRIKQNLLNYFAARPLRQHPTSPHRQPLPDKAALHLDHQSRRSTSMHRRRFPLSDEQAAGFIPSSASCFGMSLRPSLSCRTSQADLSILLTGRCCRDVTPPPVTSAHASPFALGQPDTGNLVRRLSHTSVRSRSPEGCWRVAVGSATLPPCARPHAHGLMRQCAQPHKAFGPQRARLACYFAGPHCGLCSLHRLGHKAELLPVARLGFKFTLQFLDYFKFVSDF
jgi:hypothetical protein